MKTEIKRIVRIFNASPVSNLNIFAIYFDKKGESKSEHAVMSDETAFLLSETVGVGIESITA